MFMDKDFLLNTETAKRLYHEAAEDCPIIDYHCHINPREIWEDRRYDNITQVWLGGDHYKWRLSIKDVDMNTSDIVEGVDNANDEPAMEYHSEEIPNNPFAALLSGIKVDE